MKIYKVILGVDISKLTLDISCAERRLHLKIGNESKGFAEFKKWCKINGINLKETLVIMEHTGGYEYKFIQFCESISLAYCRISGLEIKRSMGMSRGKSDKVDSFRIGQYGEERIKRLKPSQPLDKDILSLKQLLSFRKRLVRENSGLTLPQQFLDALDVMEMHNKSKSWAYHRLRSIRDQYHLKSHQRVSLYQSAITKDCLRKRL